MKPNYFRECDFSRLTFALCWTCSKSLSRCSHGFDQGRRSARCWANCACACAKRAYNVRGDCPKGVPATLNEAERVPLWQDWLTRDISVFVAEVEGEVVGFAGGGAIREAIHAYDSELYTLYLLKNDQGRGIGKALLHAVSKALVEKGHRSTLVWVREQNPAVRFYEKAGAQYLTSKQIEIGGVQLAEFALGWPDMGAASSSLSSGKS